MKVADFKKFEKELGAFVEDFAPELGRTERRYWCKLYLTGLLLDGERKSIEPMARRVLGAMSKPCSSLLTKVRGRTNRCRTSSFDGWCVGAARGKGS